MANFTNAINYAIETLCDQIYDGQVYKNHICYNTEADDTFKGIQIIPSKFFEKENYHNFNKLLKIQNYNGLVFFFGNPLIEFNGQKAVVHLDIVASAYFLLTLMHESIKPTFDCHNRIIGQSSFLFNNNLLNRPIVNEYANFIDTVFKKLNLLFERKAKKFTNIVTHDIDHFRFYGGKYQPFRTILKFLINKATLTDTFYSIKSHWNYKYDPYNYFDFFLENERTVDKSVYFIMVDSMHNEDGYNYVDDKAFIKLLKQLKSRGNVEIGLHSSYNAPEKPDQFYKEIKLFKDLTKLKQIHHRFHFLRWVNFGTTDILIKAGVKSDYSIGYFDTPGFRLGTCNSFELFDPNKLERTGLIVRPLIFMDGSVINKYYSSKGNEFIIDILKELKEKVQYYKGDFISIWHNSIFYQVNREKHFLLKLYHLTIDW